MMAWFRVYLRSQKCWNIRQKAPDARRMSAALLGGMQANATQQMGLFGRIEQRWGIFRYTLGSDGSDCGCRRSTHSRKLQRFAHPTNWILFPMMIDHSIFCLCSHFLSVDHRKSCSGSFSICRRLFSCLYSAADDVLVTVRTQEAAQIVRQCLTEFLAERGLAFSEEKTKIRPVTEPFTFLSRTYIKKIGWFNSATFFISMTQCFPKRG